MPVDLGPEFVHGKPPETWNLLRAAQLHPYDVPDRHHLFEPPDRITEQPDFWSRLDEVLSQLAKVKADVSFNGFLQTATADDQAKRMAKNFVEGFNAADAARISSKALAKDQDAEEQIDATKLFRIPGGYQRLVDHLVASLDPHHTRLHLARAVKQIAWSPGRVEVATDSPTAGPESFRAPRALVTLPVGVLKAPPNSTGAIRFLPDLPAEKQRALDHIAMGPVVKVVLRFRRAFWEDRLPDLSFLHANDDTPFPTWWTTLPFRTPVLTAWSGGPAARALADLPDPEILRRALDSLSRLLSLPAASLAADLETYDLANWHADPYARGAYSYLTVDADNAPAQLAAPVADTLFFAGEATHPGMSGTVAAALASAARAAKEIHPASWG